MEDPKLVEETLFWLHRIENGWPPVPVAMLEAAEANIKHEKENGGMAYTFCGVPVQELTEREAKAALVFLMAERFTQPLDPFRGEK